jgi:hypothetical protein
MNLNFDAFLDTLPIMGMGMAGIFIVTLVIILAMVILQKATKPKDKK